MRPGRGMRHQTTVATIWTPAMEKVMASWDLGDTRLGRAADLLASLEERLENLVNTWEGDIEWD